MRSLPILAVLLAVPTALRDGDYLPQGGAPEGDGDRPRESDLARPESPDIAPQFARIEAPAVAPGADAKVRPVLQEAARTEALKASIPDPDFAMTGSGAFVPAGAFEDGFARLEPAVLVRPVPGLDAAFAGESEGAFAPGPEPMLPAPSLEAQPPVAELAELAPQSSASSAEPGRLTVDPAIFADAGPTAQAHSSLAARVEQMQADPPAPAPRIAYELSEFDRRAAALADRSSGESSLGVTRLADDALDAPMPPRDGGMVEGEKNVFDGDFLIVAAGAVAMPSHEGSNDTVVIPAAGLAGRLGGIGISARAAGLAFDLVPDGDGAKVGVGLGPVVRLRTNRSGKITDPVVASLGKLKSVLEFGVTATLTVKRLLNEHDQLTFGADVRWDISGRGSGYVVTPAISYLTPLSRAQVVGMLVAAEFADGRFAHYNYDVSAAGSVVSGLPQYSARGGLKAASIGAFTARDLNGNLLDGGFALAVGAMYGRVYGSAAETPITSVRGRRSQWTIGAGLGYVF